MLQCAAAALLAAAALAAVLAADAGATTTAVTTTTGCLSTRAAVVPSSRTRGVFARGSSRLHLLFSGVTESSFVSYKMFNGTITPQAARSWPGQDVSREMVRLRDREREISPAAVGRARARARALTARRDGSFSVIYYTQVSKYNC